MGLLKSLFGRAVAEDVAAGPERAAAGEPTRCECGASPAGRDRTARGAVRRTSTAAPAPPKRPSIGLQ